MIEVGWLAGWLAASAGASWSSVYVAALQRYGATAAATASTSNGNGTAGSVTLRLAAHAQRAHSRRASEPASQVSSSLRA